MRGLIALIIIIALFMAVANQTDTGERYALIAFPLFYSVFGVILPICAFLYFFSQ